MKDNIVIGAVVTGLVALLFTNFSRAAENSADDVYQLPALISRLEGLEGRANNLRADITIINNKLTVSPTTLELDTELEALRRQLDNIENDLDRLDTKLDNDLRRNRPN